MPHNYSRRRFLKHAGKTSIAVSLTGMVSIDLLAACAGAKVTGAVPFITGYDQMPLPYAYNALEPAIDALTMEIHYSKHAAAYAKNAKEAAAAEKADINKPVEDVLKSISKYSSKMRNNAGGHYNHELFWKCMKAGGSNMTDGTLSKAIVQSFGSVETFKTQFGDAGKNRFGSGWAWLYADKDKQLRIGSTPNQDNPLMDISEIKGTPLLGLDVWEHAYYLKYQNRRADYIAAWWGLINWEFVQHQFNNI
jgi:superoxide dismutase, Fe-Mn family